MASTVVAQVRGSCGKKAFRSYLVTCDGSNLTVDASALDLHYIDSCQIAGVSMSGDVQPSLCVGAGTYLLLSADCVTGDTVNLWVWGY